MKSALLIHGMPSKEEYYDPKQPSLSNAHWFPWLQKQLLIKDILTYAPEMPHAYEPQWEVWCREVGRYDIDATTTLIGHSCGGGFWLRYLSENPGLTVGKVILVAPWLDPDHDEAGDFFNFQLDPELASRTEKLVIFNSDNDMGNVHKSVAAIRGTVKNVGYKEFHKHGHFCEQDMGTTEFPELLQEVVS